MSVMVSIHVNGIEKVFFKVKEKDDKVIVERPTDYSIEIPKREDLKEQVAVALIHVRREEESWKSKQAQEVTENTIFPSLNI